MKIIDNPKFLAACCLSALVALYVVGAVSHGSLRHEVQTLPLWMPIVLGFRRNEMAKWSGLACLTVWLCLMAMIWSFLLGWSHVISGHFSGLEIALTMVVGCACVCGIAKGLRWKTTVSVGSAFSVVVLFFCLQLLAVRLSFLPAIANQ